MIRRTWAVTIRYVPEGEWEAFVSEIDQDEADEAKAVLDTPTAFGGGQTPYLAACEALQRSLPYPEEEGGGDVGF